MAIHETLPRHLGLIIDGNRRWAKAASLSTEEGHRRGIEHATSLGMIALSLGVEYVSAYMFSTENWGRSDEEVSCLMKLFQKVATDHTERLHGNGMRAMFIGDHSDPRLDEDLVKAMYSAESKTAENTKGTLIYCINYGGQQEIVDAVKKAVANGAGTGDLTPRSLKRYLYAPDVPDIDLLIRTGGDKRLSNFMLWEVAYAELLFVDKYWPAFTIEDLRRAFQDFAARERRFGGT